MNEKREVIARFLAERMAASPMAGSLTADDYMGFGGAHTQADQLIERLSALFTPPHEAQPRKFSIGDRVCKTKGSSWQGRVVGFYSTSLTPVGYAVESEREPGSVQIYPEAALSILPPYEAGSPAPSTDMQMPEDWQLVPREASREMREVAMRYLLGTGNIYARDEETVVVETTTPGDVWKAMLDAAPASPQPNVVGHTPGFSPIKVTAHWANQDGDPIPSLTPIVVVSSPHIPIKRDVDARAEALARQIWGYFKGDSTGGTTAMQWFDNNKSLGGPAHIIELCRAAMASEVVR